VLSHEPHDRDTLDVDPDATARTASLIRDKMAGIDNAFDFPGVVPEYVRPLSCVRARVRLDRTAGRSRRHSCEPPWRRWTDVASALRSAGLPADVQVAGLPVRAIAGR
jgi:hypothetical protein